jgi:hypothetical protein
MSDGLVFGYIVFGFSLGFIAGICFMIGVFWLDRRKEQGR